MKAERTEPYHVDVVRRVESGHVLVLESHDLEELVGEMADMQAEGWRLVSGLAVSVREYEVRERDANMIEDRSLWLGVYTATFVRGVPGSPLGMEMGSEDG